MRALRNGAVGTAVGLLGLAFVVPFALTVANSFRHSKDIIADPLNALGGGLTLENYWTVWNQAPVLAFYANSVITTTLIVAIQLVTSVAAAYALGHLRPWGTRAVRAVIVLVLSVPVPAIAMTNYLNLAAWNVVDTRTALILPFTTSAFGVFLLTQYVEAIPAQQLDAAKLYGIGPLVRLWRVVIPNIGPGISAFAAFSFVGWWNEFFWPFIALRSEDLATVPFLVRHFQVSPSGLPDWGPLMAAATISLLPVAIMLALLQASFVRTIKYTVK